MVAGLLLAFVIVQSSGPAAGDTARPATGGAPPAAASLYGLAVFSLGALDAPAAPDAGGPPFIWPVDGWITQFFSWEHAGVDIGVEWQEPVRAARDGTVVFVGGDPCCSLGLNVVIEHDEGWSTLYAHLSEFRVSVGDGVRQGDILGIAGSTGHSTGPHVHLELHYLAFAVDPMAYFPPGIEVRLEPDATETATETLEATPTPVETPPNDAPSPTEAASPPLNTTPTAPPLPTTTPAPPTPAGAPP